MRKFYKILGVLWLCVAGVAAAEDQIMVPPVIDSEYVVGDPSAPAVIYEYGSLTCHVCAGFYKDVLPRILKDFKGKVKVVMRPFPFNALDIAGAQMILHSKNPHALAMLFYKKQKEWIGAKDQLGAMKAIAKEFGMSDEEIKVSMQNKNLENAMLAKRLIVKHTAAPVFKVGKSFLEGMPHPRHLKILLERFAYHVVECGNPIEDFDAYKEFDKMAEEEEPEEESKDKKSDDTK